MSLNDLQTMQNSTARFNVEYIRRYEIGTWLLQTTNNVICGQWIDSDLDWHSRSF